MHDILTVAFRWVHIASVITLLGGIIFARFAVMPVVAGNSDVSDAIAARFRPLFYASGLLAVLSGLYNFIQKAHGAGPTYHMLFGIKMALVLHILAVGYLSLKPGNARRSRLLLGLVISGLIVVAISGGMRLVSSQAITVAP